MEFVADNTQDSTRGIVIDKVEYTECATLDGSGNCATPTGRMVLNLRMPGQIWDSDAEASYNFHRWYRSEDGRYLVPDPIGLAGGEPGYFGYGAVNPSGSADPDGLFYGSGGRVENERELFLEECDLAKLRGECLAWCPCSRKPPGCPCHDPPRTGTAVNTEGDLDIGMTCSDCGLPAGATKGKVFCFPIKSIQRQTRSCSALNPLCKQSLRDDANKMLECTDHLDRSTMFCKAMFGPGYEFVGCQNEDLKREGFFQKWRLHYELGCQECIIP